MLLSNSQMVRSVTSPRNFAASPRSPLDMKFPPHASSKRYDYGGVGLGIVAALEKSCIMINRHEISSKLNTVLRYSESGSNRSNPVHSVRGFQFPTEIDISEEYTCVTTRDGSTKVYYNGVEFELCMNTSEGDRRSNNSMVITEELPGNNREVFRDSPDFLKSCCLCKKKLQGKDIYMYKGDKGFCSKECRSVKMMEDNLNVQHKSKSVEVLRFPYTGGEFSTGIFLL